MSETLYNTEREFRTLNDESKPRLAFVRQEDKEAAQARLEQMIQTAREDLGGNPKEHELYG